METRRKRLADFGSGDERMLLVAICKGIISHVKESIGSRLF